LGNKVKGWERKYWRRKQDIISNKERKQTEEESDEF
jgi:hypothetical protein